MAPTLFISHKHSDREIAKAVATFVEDKTGNDVKVFLSSSPEFEGPKFGENLNAQLRQALWKTDVLLLVYTTSEDDWSYCMWECGVATQEDSPDTNILVLQCGRDVPAPFQDVLRVNAHSLDDAKRLTNQLLRDPNCFPSLKGAIRGNLTDALVQRYAEELHAKLKQVVPDPDPIEQWSTWPYIRVELPKADLDKIAAAAKSQRPGLGYALVQEKAIVVAADPRAPDLFGRSGFPERIRLSELAEIWKERTGQSDAPWFESCCAQIAAGAGREFPVIRLNPMREVNGEAVFTPVLSQVQSLPFAGVVRFDLDFYNLADPRAILATSRMIKLDSLFFRRLDTELQSTTLGEIVDDLETHRWKRLPLLDENDRPKYMIHRSMIDQFIARHALTPSAGRNAAELTLADLLADVAKRTMFENSFAVVGSRASLADATAAMAALPDCNDVFVTTGGSRDEAVLGLLTNVDITKNV